MAAESPDEASAGPRLTGLEYRFLQEIEKKGIKMPTPWSLPGDSNQQAIEPKKLGMTITIPDIFPTPEDKMTWCHRIVETMANRLAEQKIAWLLDVDICILGGPVPRLSVQATVILPM